jgi:hypothetical protein
MKESIALVRSVAVSCHDFVGQQTRSAVEAVLRENGFTIRERRADDTRAWARSWIYGTRLVVPRRGRGKLRVPTRCPRRRRPGTLAICARSLIRCT